MAADRQIGALHAGAFYWEPELAPSGPVVLIISLPEQTLSAYRNGVRVAYSSISSGREGRSTPAGVFSILEKETTHFSNKYNHAPMPFMQRLTWEGVALHGGELPGYPASHGCIRLPHEFARKLYSLTTRGMTVIVVDQKHPSPTFAAQPGIVLAPPIARDAPSISATPEYRWNPARSSDGPISIVASAADRTIYVYRNGIPIGQCALQIIRPNDSLGGHVFTMLDGLGRTGSVFVPGRPSHRWMAVRTEGDTSLDDLARRVRVSSDFAAKLYDLVAPGTTIVVTDAPALRTSSSVFLMESASR